MNNSASQKHHIRQSTNFLLFTALNEIMHSTFLESQSVIGADRDLLNKLRNMKANLNRQLEKATAFIDQNGEETMRFFHMLTRTFEAIFNAAQKGDAVYFEQLLDILEAYHQGQVDTMSDQEFESLQKRLEKAESALQDIAHWDNGLAMMYEDPGARAKQALNEMGKEVAHGAS